MYIHIYIYIYIYIENDVKNCIPGNLECSLLTRSKAMHKNYPTNPPMICISNTDMPKEKN